MDYESLYTLIPKEPKKWQVQDVTLWLEFIGLAQLTEIFISQSIDGSILEHLEEKDLDEELGIKKKIVKKKLMNWLSIGLKEYTQFITEMKEKSLAFDQFKESDGTVIKLAKQPSDPLQVLQNSVKSNNGTAQGNSIYMMSSLPLPIMQNPPVEEDIQFQQQQQLNKSIKKPTQTNVKGTKSEHQLILQPQEGSQNNFYCIKETGAKIGRHSSNQILILEENVSRYHAEVTFQNGMFSISDIGSTTGTYLKILKKLELEVGMLIELGSNLFQVQSIEEDPSNGEFIVQILVIEGPNQDMNYNLNLGPNKPHWMIGRKSNADLPFLDDHHLSNLHAKIYYIDNKVYIEDYSSTNGTWLRLSPEGQASQPYPLNPADQHIIRIGTTNQYLCQLNQQTVNELPTDSMCIICCEKERDSLYLPCKHNATCLKCSKNLSKCPICRVKIQEQMRIYKN